MIIASPSIFFGDLSPFEMLISGFALFTGVWTFVVPPIRRHFNRRPLAAFPAETLGIVMDAQGKVTGFHLRIAIANISQRLATLTKLEGLIRFPDGGTLPIKWDQFFRYSDSGLQIDSHTFPIAVPREGSDARFIQFVPTDVQTSPWSGGDYQFILFGHVDGSRKPRLELSRKFSLIEEVMATKKARTKKNNNEGFVFNVDLTD